MLIKEILDAATVIPVLEVPETVHAGELAHSLAAGGLRVVEATLRTPNAIEVLATMKRAEPNLIVGMGTVLSIEDMKKSIDAGADFLVTPGTPPTLAAEIMRTGIAALPGAATSTEVMILQDFGFQACKFFPAEAAGGIAYIKSLYGPISEITFCPTGGISRDKAPEYLSLPNVACVGGSWIATKAMIKDAQWEKITANATAAASLKK